MTVFDHLVAVLLVLVFPPLSAWGVPQLAQRVAVDPLNARTNVYFWNMAILWGLTTVLVAGWWWAGRPVRDLGLQLPNSTSAWGWTLLIIGTAIALFGQQGFSVLRSPDAQAKLRKQVETQPAVRTVLPVTLREARVFSAAVITAGICEEVLYRGYLLWYFLSLVPAGVAIAAAIVAFGVAHAYQGARGIFGTGVAGAIFLAVYLLTGSLLAAIVLHAALDLVNGFLAYRVFREEGASA